MNYFKLFVFVFFSVNCALSQNIALQNTLTPEQIVQNVLIGQGVIVSNITYNGSAPNAANIQGNVLSFDATGTAFPFADGALLRTNGGPGTVNYDPDLNAIATNNVTNGVVLEFDFIPTGDTLSFNYMFASLEYPTYVCSGFNDVFGFFISGPGFNGPYQNNAENIALVPGTNVPVAINTVNSGVAGGAGNPATCAAQDPNWQSNSIYYTTQYAPYNGYSYNGGTVSLSANASLICGETYHIKLAIANVGDQALDSGVYLESESFVSSDITITAVPSVIQSFTDTLLAENCVSSEIYIVRPSHLTDTSFWFQLNWEGTVDPYADLETWQDSVFFEYGQDTIVIGFNPIQDNLDEVDEWLTLYAFNINCLGDTTITSITLWITDRYPFGYDLSPDPTIQCLTDSAYVGVSNIQGSIPPYTYDWSSGETADSIWMYPSDQPIDTIMYFVDVYDGCGWPERDTVYLIVNQTLQVDTTYSFPTPCGLQEGAVVAIVSGITGPQNGVEYEWSGPGEDSPNTYNATVWENLSSGWYYFSVEDQVCQAFDSVFVDIENPPVANVSASPAVGYSPLTVNFTNNSENASSYYWWFGNGNDLSIDNMSGQTQVYDTVPGDYIMFLVAYEGGCTDTAYATITIVELIPAPEVATPNTFTPNGDGTNDLWLFTVLEHVEEVHLVITNRWGNIIHETTSPNPTWDGNDMKGKEMLEGVYFYKYIARGLNGDELEGHGFIHLHR